MTGFYIPPDYIVDRVPGQVPRFDSVIDRTSTAVTPLAPAPGLMTKDYVDSLIHREAAAAPNEVRLRQSMMLSLLERGVSGEDRRAILNRAVTYYRKSKKSNAQSYQPAQDRGPRRRPNPPPRLTVEKAERRTGEQAGDAIIAIDSIPDLNPDEADAAIKSDGPRAQYPVDDAIKSLTTTIHGMLSRNGQIGIHTRKLAPLVRKHGGHAVHSALRSIGVKMHNDRIFLHKSAKPQPAARPRGRPGQPQPDRKLILRTHARGPESLAKAGDNLPEQLPKQNRGVGNDEGGQDADPIGTRRIWNRRVVEKKADGKWHVVGHVAGLEDPKKVETLDTGILSRQNLLHLLQQLMRMHHIQNDGKVAKSGRQQSSLLKVYGGGEFTLPANHKAGMRVPSGGSSCANCHFLGPDAASCENTHWVAWHGGDACLPAPAHEYCCDWYQPDGLHHE